MVCGNAVQSTNNRQVLESSSIPFSARKLHQFKNREHVQPFLPMNQPTIRADNSMEPLEDPGTVCLYDLHCYPSSIYNIDTNQLMYPDCLANTFNSEWGSDPWFYHSHLRLDMPHIPQSYSYSGTGLSGPLLQGAGTSVAQGTYATPATSSTWGGPHFQSGVPASSNTSRSYLSNFYVSGSASVLSYAPPLGEDPQHLCDCGQFIAISTQTDTYIYILVKLMGPMKARGLVNWTSAICGAVGQLCRTFTEGPTVLIPPMLAEEALAESIFTCVKHSSNYYWVPAQNIMEGKFQNTPLILCFKLCNSSVARRKKDSADYAEQFKAQNYHHEGTC